MTAGNADSALVGFRVSPQSHQKITRQVLKIPEMRRKITDREPEATFAIVNPSRNLAFVPDRKINAHQRNLPTPHENAGKRLTAAARCCQLMVLERLLALFPSREAKGVAVVTRPRSFCPDR